MIRLFGAVVLTGLLSLGGCAGGAPPVSLDQVKAYTDAGIIALLAAAQQYEAGPPAPSAANLVTVQTIAASLVTAKASLDAITVPADYKSVLLEAVALMQQLEPLVAPKLGPTAAYLPLSIAVAGAFIAALPPPASAPPTPPAVLVNKGAEYQAKP